MARHAEINTCATWGGLPLAAVEADPQHFAPGRVCAFAHRLRVSARSSRMAWRLLLFAEVETPFKARLDPDLEAEIEAEHPEMPEPHVESRPG